MSAHCPFAWEKAMGCTGTFRPLVRTGYRLFAFLTLFAGIGAVSYRHESRKAERFLREALERKGGVLPNPHSV